MRGLATYKLSDKAIDTILNIVLVISLIILGIAYYNNHRPVNAQNPESIKYYRVSFQKIDQPQIQPMAEATLMDEKASVTYSLSSPTLVSQVNSSNQSAASNSGANSLTTKSNSDSKNQIIQVSDSVQPIQRIVNSIKL